MNNTHGSGDLSHVCITGAPKTGSDVILSVSWQTEVD